MTRKEIQFTDYLLVVQSNTASNERCGMKNGSIFFSKKNIKLHMM